MNSRSFFQYPPSGSNLRNWSPSQLMMPPTHSFSTLQAGRTSATSHRDTVAAYALIFQYPPSGSNLCNQQPHYYSTGSQSTFSTLQAGRTSATQITPPLTPLASDF